MIGLLKIAGSKIIQAAAIALAVGWTLFFVIQYIQTENTDRVLQETRIEQLEEEVEIRRNVDEILQENRESNPDRSGSIALDRLLERSQRNANTE